MAYSKTKLKSNGDETSPYFKPVPIENISDMDFAKGFIKTHFY